MAQIKIEVTAARKARFDAALLLSGKTTEEAMEAWLQDIERSIGHDPSESQEDQDAALARAVKKGDKAKADRIATAAALQAGQ